MTKPKMILHVGLPKTGSSALQTLLYDNRAKLLEHGVDYPDTGQNTVPPKHQFLVEALLAKNITSVAACLDTCQHPTTVLSTEGLTNHLYDFNPDILAEFRALLAPYDVTLFAVLRNPTDWARSYYKQAVINPDIPLVDFYATSLTFTEFSKHPRVRQLCDAKTVKADLTQAFGADVVSAHYEDDWLAAFENTVGVSGIDWSRTKRVNESPSAEVIALMRQVNQYHLPEPRRVIWKAVLARFKQSTHTSMNTAAKTVTDMPDLESDILMGFTPTDDPDFPLSAEALTRFHAFVAQGA